MIQNHPYSVSLSNKNPFSLSLLIICLQILLLTQCVTKYDLNYPNRLRELCQNNRLTFFQQSIEKTRNGNQIYVYGITAINNPDHQNSDIKYFFNKEAILVTGFMHPRQETSFFFIENAIIRLINMYRQGDQQIKYFLSRSVVLLMPFVNIDGIMYSLELTKKQALSVRKNLDYDNSTKCKLNSDKGVDINRNFDYNFGTQKTSSNQCGQQYHGKKPFSQPQSRSIKQMFENFQVITNIDVHSYGNLWIYPYASEQNQTKIQNHQLYPSYQYIFKKLKKKNVTYASCYESLQYVADGVFIDWALERNSLSFALQFGDDFYKVGSQTQKQIEAFIEVLKINTAAFEYYIEVDTNSNSQNIQKFNQEYQYKFCIKSLSTASHNVTLVIDQKDIQTTFIQSRSNVCYQSSFKNVIQQSSQDTGRSNVYIRLGHSFQTSIAIEKLEYRPKIVDQKLTNLQQLWAKFKIALIIGAILYCIGSICGLSVFCEKAFGLTLHQEQSNRLSSEGTVRNEVYLEQSNQELEFQKQLQQK